MISTGIIGMGNAGSQVAVLASEKLKIPAMAINSSEKDLETVPSTVTKVQITAKDQLSKGAGKDRKLAKKYLKDSIIELIKDDDEGTMKKFLKELDLCFIVSSTGGGTGSGISPVMTAFLANTFQEVKFIIVGILPVDSESLDTHGNTLEYLTELYSELPNVTYMLYDNDKFSSLPSYKILETVNSEIVEDINVLRCNYNYTTRYDSIDDQDMSRLINVPGKLTIARVDNFKDKDADKITIEDMLIDKIKVNAHVENQRDLRVHSTGLIVNLSKTLNNELDDNIPKVVKFVGEPIHAFKHIFINAEKDAPNNVFYIYSGGSKINDKIDKIKDRIDEINKMQDIREDDSSLDDIDIASITNKIADKGNGLSKDGINLKETFARFGLE